MSSISRLLGTASVLVLLSFTQFAAAATPMIVTVNQSPARIGEQVMVRIVVANDGAAMVQDLQVTMVYPQRLQQLDEHVVHGGLNAFASCGSGPGNDTCQGGETLIWDIDQIEPGRRRELSFPTSVSSGTPNGTLIDLTAMLTIDDVAQNSATATLPVTTRRGGQVSIVPNKDAVSPGDEVVYTIDYAAHTDNMTDVSLDVQLPAQATIVSSSGGTVNGQNVTWSLGDLPLDQTRQQRITVTMDAAALSGTLLAASATLNGTISFLSTERQEQVISMIGAKPPLEIALGASKSPVRSLENTLFNVRVSNPTDQTIADTQLVLRIPESVIDISRGGLLGGTFNDASCNQIDVNAVCSANELLVRNIPLLAPGQSMEFSFFGRQSGVNNLLRWRAELVSVDDSWSYARLNVPVDRRQTATLLLQADQDPVAPGAGVQYRLRFSNPTDTAMTDAALEVVLPDGLTLSAASDTPTASGNSISWTLGTLPAGHIGERHLDLATEPGTIPGTLRTLLANLTFTDDGMPAAERTATTVVVSQTSALDIAIQTDAAFATNEQDTTMSLRVSNPTSQITPAGTIFVVVPENFEAISEALILGGLDTLRSCGSSSSSLCTQYELLWWPLVALDPGQSATLTVPARVRETFPAGLMMPWLAQVQQDDGSITFAATSTALAASPAIDLALEQSADPVAPGTELDYDLSFGNTGDADLIDAQLVVELPPQTIFVSASDNGTLLGNSVTWPIALLSANQTARRQVKVIVDSAAVPGSLLETTAQLHGTTANGPSMQRTERTTRVASAGPLLMTLDISPTSVQPGERALLDVHVFNPGAAVATDTQVRIRVPAGYSIIYEDTPLGPINADTSCEEVFVDDECTANETLSIDLASIDPGQSAFVSIPVTVAPDTLPGSLLEWQAWLEPDDGYPQTETATVAVDNNVAPSLAVDQSADPITRDTVFYTLRYGNPGTVDLDNAVVTLVLPEGGSVQSATGDATLTGRDASWSIGTLAAGAVGQRVVQFAAPEVSYGTPLRIRAGIIGTADGRDLERLARNVTTVAPAGSLALHLSANPLPALPGESPLVSISLVNYSTTPVADATLSMSYPDRLDALSETAVTGNLDIFASCQQAGPANFCSADDVLVWTMPEIAFGERRTFTLPPTVSAQTPLGSVIPLLVRLDRPGTSAIVERVSLLVGADATGDVDGDLVGDEFDNCTQLANPLQTDSDDDGYGNACDGDFNNDGIVNVVDLGLMRSRFFTNDPDADLDGNGVVNVVDLGILRSLFFQSPGPSALVP